MDRCQLMDSKVDEAGEISSIATSPAATAVARVRNELDRRGWSQRRLADKAALGEATVFRFLKGKFTRKTLRKIQQALEIYAEVNDACSGEIAELQYGAYPRDLYRYLEGEYLFVREAFSDNAKYCIYRMSIEWSVSPQALAFIDHNPGYEQRGFLAMPRGTQFIHFLTLDTGSARLMSAFHMPPSHKMMHGLTLTFANPAGRTLYPTAAPFMMIRLDQELQDLLDCGTLIDKTSPGAQQFNVEFDRINIRPVTLHG